MSAIAVGGIVFACVFGGALLGLGLRRVLPESHLTESSQSVVQLGMGLLATMAALVLGLLLASAKNSYDTQNAELTQLAAGIILLDRALGHYGPETGPARDALRGGVERMIERTWPSPDAARRPELNPLATDAEGLYETIQNLVPQSEGQRVLRTEALKMAADLARTRWLLFAQGGSSIPLPFLTSLVFWISMIFVSFGLFAPRNATVVAAMLICALSVSAAIVLILELDEPFKGFIQASSASLRMALANLGH